MRPRRAQPSRRVKELHGSRSCRRPLLNPPSGLVICDSNSKTRGLRAASRHRLVPFGPSPLPCPLPLPLCCLEPVCRGSLDQGAPPKATPGKPTTAIQKDWARPLASSSVSLVPKDEGSGQPLVTVWSLLGHFHCTFEGHRRASLPRRLRSSNARTSCSEGWSLRLVHVADCNTFTAFRILQHSSN